MDEMKQRFVNAVTYQLSPAPEGSAKAELIEELSENLYRRYLDMTAAGISEGEAFEKALDDLGDVNELIDYLKSLAPDEELPKLTLDPGGLESLLKDAMDAAERAMDAVSRQGKKRSTTLRSDDGEFEIHLDYYDDDHGEHPFGEDHEDELEAPEREPEDPEDSFDKDEDIADTGIPSQGLRGIDIQTINGDVTIRLAEDEHAPVTLEDYDGLEIKRTDDDVLAIRQGNTAASSFFFGRGILSADVELTLPRRFWEFIQITTTNGDVTVEGDMETGRLSVKTACGDLTADCAACGQLHVKSASGDVRVTGLTGDSKVETMSGDIRLHGHMGRLNVTSMSGDVEVSGSFTDGLVSSMSGDLRLETGILPQTMEVSSKSGDCQVYLPGDQGGFTLRCKTVSGDFHSQLPLRRTGRGVTYGDGGDRTFTLSTVSGDVRLRKF